MNRDTLEDRLREILERVQMDPRGGPPLDSYLTEVMEVVDNEVQAAVSSAGAAAATIATRQEPTPHGTGFGAMQQVDPAPHDPGKPDVVDLVVRDYEERKALGRSRYGVALQPNNGRDPLLDMYQEDLDRLVYLRQLLYERHGR